MKNIPDEKYGNRECRAVGIFAALMLMAGASDVIAGGPMMLSTDPVEPSASQSFDVVYEAFCEDVFPAYTPSNRSVEVEGDIVRITVRRLWQFCLGQPHPPTYSWRIGPLPPGDYQVELVGYEYEPQTLFPIASGEVTIVPVLIAPEPNVVPATGKLGLLSLSLLTALLAMWRLRRW